MVQAVVNFLSRAVGRAWLTGPIFSKELRVSSRRRRSYVLRFVYLALLTLFVGLVWYRLSRWGSGGSAYRISRMAEAGKGIISTIVWFEFIVGQLIAVILLSTSISDEIYNRTLGVLMSTPISSLQIVMGKLLSKLWQLVLLLAISLPLLAIVRVFGGVPWNFVIAGLGITLTTSVFLGSVSLYFSIFNRRAYAAILKTICTSAVLFGFLPLVGAWVFTPPARSSTIYTLASILLHVNPYAAMVFSQQMMMRPMWSSGGPFFSWVLHCLIMLGFSMIVLAICVKVVRKVALRQANGEEIFRPRRRRAPAADITGQADHGRPHERIRPVVGSPIVWKELRTPMLKNEVRGVIAILAAIGALLVTYLICYRGLDESETHAFYAVIFVIIGTLTTAVLSATSITAEKESRAMPILLCTPLGDAHIVFGKAVGVFRRVLPIWLFLAGHVVIFVLARCIHPVAIFHLAMLVSWIVVFLTGSGLYFSASCRKTTTAVVMNVGLCAVLWVIAPIVLRNTLQSEHVAGWFIDGNPPVQAGILTEGSAGKRNARESMGDLRYGWAELGGKTGAGEATVRILIYQLAYCTAGLLFALRAKAKLRRNIF